MFLSAETFVAKPRRSIMLMEVNYSDIELDVTGTHHTNHRLGFSS